MCVRGNGLCPENIVRRFLEEIDFVFTYFELNEVSIKAFSLMVRASQNSEYIESERRLYRKLDLESIMYNTDYYYADKVAAPEKSPQKILLDLKEYHLGDPAAQNREEVAFAYPGLFAIFAYRVAHLLYLEAVPMIPRMMTEYAHSRTGIDIHPGAEIGSYFFIDHGTGIVIGETTNIGEHVKIYQGVTLGALSPRGGRINAHGKRHPTVNDGATVYSGASIFGGETVIGERAVVGSNAFLTSSVEADTRVVIQPPEIKVRSK